MNQIGKNLAQLQIEEHSISDNEIENESNMSESELEQDLVETEVWKMRLAPQKGYYDKKISSFLP